MSMYPQDELVTSSGACAAAGGWFTWHGKLIYRSMSTANNNKVGGGFPFLSFHRQWRTKRASVSSSSSLLSSLCQWVDGVLSLFIR